MLPTFKTWLAESVFEQSQIYINTPRGRETYSVPALSQWAKVNLRPQQVSLEWLRQNINEQGFDTLWEQPDPKDEFYTRSASADTNYPILIIKEQNTMWIGDGNHRIYKAIHISKQNALPAYIIDVRQLPPPQELAGNKITSFGHI